MFGKRVNLFRLFGFQVRIDASWLFVAALIAWSLAVSVFPTEYPELPYSTYWIMGALGMLGLFASIVVHELCHALVARRFGLNMRGITLFIFGGVAEMADEPQSARAEFVMAIAGPIASVIIGLVCLGIRYTLAPSWPTPARGVIAYLAWINLALAAFNMIPAFPLDGGRVLRSILWRWKGDLTGATRVSSTIGTGLAGVLMIVAVIQLFTGQFVSAVWMFMIGLFIRSASQQSYEQLVMKNALQGVPVKQFMRAEPISVPADLSLARLVDEYMYRHHFKLFPVVDEDTGEVVGCVSARAVGELPREKWPWRTVREVMSPCAAENSIGPDTDAMEALTIMSRSGNSRLMVMDQGRLVGILTLRDLMSFLAMKLQLDGKGAGVRSSSDDGGFGSRHHPAAHHHTT